MKNENHGHSHRLTGYLPRWTGVQVLNQWDAEEDWRGVNQHDLVLGPPWTLARSLPTSTPMVPWHQVGEHSATIVLRSSAMDLTYIFCVSEA